MYATPLGRFTGSHVVRRGRGAVAVRRGVGAVGLGAASMSVQQVYDVARNAGFPPEKARMMVAIAQRESSLIPTARCHDCLKDPATGLQIPEDSIGLWQINMNPAWAAARRAQFGISSNDELLDPQVNARAAYKLWNGNDANLNTVWAINKNEPYPYRDRYLAFLNALPSSAVLEGSGGTSSGGGSGCPAVVKTCSDNVTVGYKPGTCEFEDCPDPSDPCGYCRGSLICLAGCQLLGPNPPAGGSTGGGSNVPPPTSDDDDSKLYTAIGVGAGLALILWAVFD